MKKLSLLLAATLLSLVLMGQERQTPTPNYELAARYSPDNLRKVVFSTRVSPHWLRHSDRFWYEYATSEGKRWYLVDPARATKKVLFDNDKIAADMSRLTGDPFDAKNLDIQNLKFSDDEKKVTWEVTSKLVEVEEKQDEDEEKEKAKKEEEKGDKKEDKKDDKEKKEDDKEEDDMENKEDSKRKRKKKPKMVPKVWHFEYDIATQQLRLLDDKPKKKDRMSWASISPDSSYVLFSRDHNLYWMDKENFLKAVKDEKDTTIVENQWTEDGEEFYSYGRYQRGMDNAELKKEKDKRKPVSVVWSPSGNKFGMIRSDDREVEDLWVINNTAKPRPTLETYKYAMAGEKEVGTHDLYLFDFPSKDIKKLAVDTFKQQDISIMYAPGKKVDRDNERRIWSWLHQDDSRLYFSRISRDMKRMDVCYADTETGDVHTVIEERLNTYIGSRTPVVVNGGKEYIHWSERDGWAHFYLYDDKGNVKNQITSGPWHCDGIEAVDEQNRVLYFTANGREKGEDPYYMHLYRVNFDGTGLKLLNPGNYSHTPSVNDAGSYFVDNYSRVNTVPATTLHDGKGRKIMDLETADLSQLMATGYQFPEPFKAKAADGITDIYGVMYKPFDFDSTLHYPLLEYVYPGPQTEAVNKAWSGRMDRTDRTAQMGFIVITLGNRGGHPIRSKRYHNYGYGNLRDYGLADKKYVAEQLADRHDFIDISKVGIFGHSGGGFMSTAAMLVYPDFYDVAVSSSGNHDNAVYNRWWSERHHGVKEIEDESGEITFKYAIDKNPDIAKNLKGKLLVTTGDMDNNVHPAGTIRMVKALIDANKRFDYFLFPSQRHGYGNMNEYFFWLRSDYFAEHLLGDYDRNTDIKYMNNERQQKR